MISRISLSEKIAKQVAEVAQKEAIENNWMVSIAVVNEAGHLLYFTKMDNTTNASGDIAIAKARHASYYRRDTEFHEDLLAKGNFVVLSLPHSLPIEGGVQLIYDNQVLGAIGVSGVASHEDGKIAKAGASFLINII
jgi:glc operon protein GlcG